MKPNILVLLWIALGIILPYDEGSATMPQSQQRTILAIGAHAGDMEISCGAVLAKHARLGDRVVMLHLTLGEGGNPRITPQEYGEQKHREATEVASILGAEVIFGPYKDGEIPNSEEIRAYVNDVIRQVQPTHIITHWKNSIHKDHSFTYAIVTDAVLLASLEGVTSTYPRHRGVRGVYFTENWEDMEDYVPYIYLDVTEDLATWEEAVRKYEFIGGTISSFRYFDYYKALSTVRGAIVGYQHAVTFTISEFGMRLRYDTLP
jgi:N-acetylglucosamine malate deacetylase 1